MPVENPKCHPRPQHRFLKFLDILEVRDFGGKIWVHELSLDIILNEIMKRFKINAGDLRERFLGVSRVQNGNLKRGAGVGDWSDR